MQGKGIMLEYASQVTPVMNESLNEWVQAQAELCQPDHIHWCDGSTEEYDALCAEMVESGTFIKLNEELRPGSFLARSDPKDVARIEDRTFICTQTEDEAGPTNNWRDRDGMKAELLPLFRGSMRSRTMYVIPFLMGPIGSPLSRLGVQLTDSPYVVCSMRLMTRMGLHVLEQLNGDFVRCLHSVGHPLEPGEADVPWPSNDKKYIVHFPQDCEIWSFGSGYGGNALLSKKCFALRIASAMARREGWFAEHMLILGITNPEGRKIYIAAAFPSQCGKTNMAMMQPSLPGWKAECVGDDIAWMGFCPDGRLYAINPEAGFFGVAPGTSHDSNPNAMETIRHDTLFTNVALTPDGDVWWEGMTEAPPAELTSWRGERWTPESKQKAAHPNSRFTVALEQCPSLDPDWNSPQGVPISAILFGGRRPTTEPLALEAVGWQQGVFFGSTVASETTAAADGAVGKVRRDPFAMLPFCGYNMGDYFRHWLEMGQTHQDKLLPKIYAVNWFRKGSDGRWLWPGYGENIRVLKWIFERLEGTAQAVETPIGRVPEADQLVKEGEDIPLADVEAALTFDKEAWQREAAGIREYYAKFGRHLPAELTKELNALEARLAAP